MSLWIKNLQRALQDKQVIILHGNVRDDYIDDQGRSFHSLTDILMDIAVSGERRFDQMLVWDPVGQDRTTDLQGGDQGAPSSSSQSFPPDATEDRGQSAAQILRIWAKRLQESQTNLFCVLYYLDKVVSYRSNYDEVDRKTILWIEKCIEHMKDHHRLILVALQDTLVPVELYTNLPKCRMIPIPRPDKAERMALLKRRLEGNTSIELIADLTEGLFLRELVHIIEDVSEKGNDDQREIKKIINQYKVGEREDHWTALGIEKLDGALSWFTESQPSEGGGGIVNRVIEGQDEAVRKVIDVLTVARAGLAGIGTSAATRPKGALFFAGPTGVGKTLLAKKLAHFLFGSEEEFIRFDMSEFKQEHTDAKLIGSPPGYVGYERGGMLTNAVRERPFSVVLFDEIEKAHPKIMDIFLQILDEGRLTDSRGQTVFLTESVIIFTSNIGDRSLDSHNAPCDEHASLSRIKESSPEEARKQKVRAHFIASVERFFRVEIARPELLNRISGNIVPFNFIDDPNHQRSIALNVMRKMESEFNALNRGAGHTLAFSDSIVDHLVETYEAKISEFGGRWLVQILEGEVFPRLARDLLFAEKGGLTGRKFEVLMSDGRIRTRIEERA